MLRNHTAEKDRFEPSMDGTADTGFEPRTLRLMPRPARTAHRSSVRDVGELPLARTERPKDDQAVVSVDSDPHLLEPAQRLATGRSAVCRFHGSVLSLNASDEPFRGL